MSDLYQVNYAHRSVNGLPYRVSYTFTSQEDAQSFIDTNALVCPLPDVKLLAPGESLCGCWNYTHPEHCIHTTP